MEKTQKELSQSIDQCKAVTTERDLLKEELAELRSAAEAVVAMVDPIEEGSTSDKALVDRLKEAPQKITKFLTETSKDYVGYVLGLVKSYWPQARLAPLGEGMVVECSEEDFTKYTEEAKPIADKIVDMLEQESDAGS